MNTYLKHYRMRIKTLSPVFIGDGTKIEKKEYIYDQRSNKIDVPDIFQLYQYLEKHRLAGEYADYVFQNDNRSLDVWMRQKDAWGKERVPRQDWKEFVRYSLDASGIVFDVQSGGRMVKAKEINCFIKDAYGRPYVPGSSIKGMLRTALLAYELQKDDGLRKRCGQNIATALDRDVNKKRQILSRETKGLEEDVFHTLERERVKQSDAVCCNLSGLIVGDSDPLKVEDLTLCQKIDYGTEGQEKALNLLREALKPGTEICFDLTIDASVCPYGIEELMKAVDVFGQLCYERFYHKFGRGRNEKGIVWLGGGCGFASKTVLHAIFDEKATEMTSKVFRATLGKNYQVHKHQYDVQKYRVSPHVCKCTRYRNNLYDMGMCRIEVVS